MSGEKVVVDTNVMLYYLDGDNNVAIFFEDNKPQISFISELEALSAPELSIEEKDKINILLSVLTIYPFREEFKEATIKIRSRYKLKLPDAIIAATALTMNLPLVTGDKAFKKVEGLDILFYEPTIS